MAMWRSALLLALPLGRRLLTEQLHYRSPEEKNSGNHSVPKPDLTFLSHQFYHGQTRKRNTLVYTTDLLFSLPLISSHTDSHSYAKSSVQSMEILFSVARKTSQRLLGKLNISAGRLTLLHLADGYFGRHFINSPADELLCLTVEHTSCRYVLSLSDIHHCYATEEARTSHH